MRVLLTGVGGFIGSHCLEYFHQRTDWHIVGLDSFRHKGTYSRLADAEYDPDRLTVLNHDLAVPLDSVLEKKIGPVDVVINMASDSAVERSVTDPLACLRNNYELGINMLEYARRARPRVFFQISTDEVYGEAMDGAHPEWSPIMPSNPYAASKAAQEAVAIAYWRSYDLPVVLTNTMNCIGERQDVEKFIPKVVRMVAQGKTVPIYGEAGKVGSRFYLHCKNMADALVFLSTKQPARYTDGAARPDRYNVVGDVELDNLQVAQMVAACMGKNLKYEFVASESARPGYDRRYALDGRKMAAMGWEPPISTKEAIERLVRWTLEHKEWV